METGYIKLYRSSMSDPLYLKDSFTKWQAWCDLILLAYFAPSEFFVRNIKVKAKRGCVYKSVLELAERWRWSRGKVERFIAYLIEEKRICVQRNNIVSCISIVNYEKYQQNDTINETASEASTEHDNSNQTLLLQKLIEQVSELKERLDAQDQKVVEKKPTTKRKVVNPLITKGREIFEKRYADLFDGGVYYWQAKDAVAMDSLTKKIIHSRQQKGMSTEDDDVLKALVVFLNSITDPWLLKNYCMTRINGKYNEIVAQARAAVNNNSNNGNNKSTSKERAQDAASIIANLAAQEGSDDNPIW